MESLVDAITMMRRVVKEHFKEEQRTKHLSTCASVKADVTHASFFKLS